MGAPAASEDQLAEALEKLSDRLDVGDPADDPAGYVRAIHVQWKQEGGLLSGKPRHSDRFLSEQLSQQRTPVRSLTPKLAGKTRIRGNDASALLRYFLANWPEEGSEDSSDTVISYAPLLEVDDIRGAVDYVTSLLDADEPAATPSDPADADTLPGRPYVEIALESYEDALGLITVSPENTLIVPDKKTALIGFRNIMNDFWAIERKDNQPRILGWVVDIGRQTFEDENARTVYMNVQNLQTRFKALRDFDDRNAAERWEWLKSRVFIVIFDGRHDEGAPLPRAKRPLFMAHHVSFSAVAPAWLALPEFRGLYGSNLERLNDRNFVIFPQEDGEFRYLGLATFLKGPKERDEKQLRSIELPSPGANYDDALRTVTLAGASVLQVPLKFGIENKTDGHHSVEKLRHLGYRVLKLEDFLKEY
jgi:hypothetical protein